jgi:hypothetical protein
MTTVSCSCKFELKLGLDLKIYIICADKIFLSPMYTLTLCEGLIFDGKKLSSEQLLSAFSTNTVMFQKFKTKNFIKL